jgi:hypothetical protein
MQRLWMTGCSDWVQRVAAIDGVVAGIHKLLRGPCANPQDASPALFDLPALEWGMQVVRHGG